MDAGEIKIVISAGYPILYVCDGTKTAAHWFLTQTTDQSRPSYVPANGEVVAFGIGTSPSYGCIAIGYGGKWWRTTEDWHNDTTISGGANNELAVLPWNRGDINGTPPDLPAILIRRTGIFDGHFWCADGWILS